MQTKMDLNGHRLTRYFLSDAQENKLAQAQAVVNTIFKNAFIHKCLNLKNKSKK
jgi:hypothetical protein